MPKVGDRVVVDGLKVGGARREGTLTGQVGRLIRVRWADGTETLLAPGAGTVSYVPGSSKSKKPEPSTKQPPKPKAKTKKKKK